MNIHRVILEYSATECPVRVTEIDHGMLPLCVSQNFQKDIDSRSTQLNASYREFSSSISSTLYTVLYMCTVKTDSSCIVRSKLSVN